MTLMELLISAGFLLLTLMALYGYFRGHLFTLRRQEARIDARQRVDLATDFIVRDLRMAGARPVDYPLGCLVGAILPILSSLSGPLGCPCNGQTVVPSITLLPPCIGFERLLTACKDSIGMQMDLTGNAADTPPDGCPEYLQYSYNPGTRSIERTEGVGATGPRTTAVLISDVPPGGLTLRYFREDGSELLPGGLGINALNRVEVQRVEVHVQVEVPPPDPRDTTPITEDATSVVYLRNPEC